MSQHNADHKSRNAVHDDEPVVKHTDSLDEILEEEAEEQRRCFSTHTADMLVMLVQFLVFSMCFVATPIAQFETPGRGCFTYWGYKHYCANTKYDKTGVEAFGCAKRAGHMHAGAAFGVLSTVASAALLAIVAIKVSPLYTEKRIRAGIVLGLYWALSVAVLLCTLIAFAVVAAVYTQDMCGTGSYKQYTITAGFAMMVIAFGLQLISWALAVPGWYC